MQVVIIGNGVAGITAARRLRRKQPGWRITVVSGECDYHYSRPALMYVFLGHMRLEDARPVAAWRYARERIELRRAWVTHIDTHARSLSLHDNTTLSYDKLLIATGSQPNRFGWPGQDLGGVQGFYDLLDLRRLTDRLPVVQRAVIVGGGLIGIELAEMLHAHGVHVTLLVREPSYWSNVLPREESALVNRVIREQGLDLLLNTELTEILDNGKGDVGGVVASHGRRLDCDLVGLTAGVRPNLSALKDSGIATGRGVLVDSSFGTSADDVFAAGDCAEFIAPQGQRNFIEQVWYTARAQGRRVADVIAGEPGRYERGIWFNSAKFFDLEYQVYGEVPSTVGQNESLYWEHPDRRHALRLVHHGGNLTGLCAMGIRYRHRVCERWIAQGRAIEAVIAGLGDACFDPEFYRRYEPEIAIAFSRQLKEAS